MNIIDMIKSIIPEKPRAIETHGPYRARKNKSNYRSHRHHKRMGGSKPSSTTMKVWRKRIEQTKRLQSKRLRLARSQTIADTALASRRTLSMVMWRNTKMNQQLLSAVDRANKGYPLNANE